jgi:hypothetical protein
MPKDKGPEWNHVSVTEDGSGRGTAYVTMQCLYCDKTYSGGVNRIRAHLVGGDTSISKCDKVPDEVLSAMTALSKDKEQHDREKKRRCAVEKLTKAEGTDTNKSQKTVTQTSIVASFNAGSKAVADAAVAKFFYANGIPFSVIESKYLKEAFSAVAKCGPGYKLPSRAAVSDKLLNEAVVDVDKKLAEFKVQMSVTGATLISDGWTNVQNRPIINYLAVTPDGAMFIDGNDTSGEHKDAKFIAAEIRRNIESLGAENIVQVVTDSAGNCTAARKLLREEYPNIVFSPCTAHCLDLLLEDIGKLSWAAPLISKGHAVVKFITNHQASLAQFRKRSTLELLKPGETRFGSFFLMLQRLLQAKDALQETVMNRDFKQWMTTIKKTASQEEGRNVVDTVVDERFWKSSEELTCLCEPIISLLRLVDGIAPCVGKVYWNMFQIDNGVEPSKADNHKKIQLRTCINERWKMMHTELHSAGFVLDPEFRLFLQHENEEVMSDFHTVVERVFKDNVQAQVKAIQQHATYRAGHGLFSRPMADAAAKEMPAFRWWLAFGAHVPELQRVAVRVLSQVTSSSASERNWSTFDFIHTKKRNRLHCKRVRDIVYVHSNLRLSTKLQDVAYTEGKIPWSFQSATPADDEDSETDSE